MANEAGSGCSALDEWGELTAISSVTASIGGNCDRLGVYINVYDTGSDIVFAFFTRDGNDFTTVVDTRIPLVSAAETETCHEFNAPGDFTAFAVSAGNYLGCYGQDGIHFSDAGGAGAWFTGGDHTSAAGFTFTNEASGDDPLTADITAVGGLSIPVAMHHLTKNIGA